MCTKKQNTLDGPIQPNNELLPCLSIECNCLELGWPQESNCNFMFGNISPYVRHPSWE